MQKSKINCLRSKFDPEQSTLLDHMCYFMYETKVQTIYAYVQSGQSLYYSLSRKDNSLSCHMQNVCNRHCQQFAVSAIPYIFTTFLVSPFPAVNRKAQINSREGSNMARCSSKSDELINIKTPYDAE